MEDVYSILGFGKVSGRDLLNKFISPEDPTNTSKNKSVSFTSTVKKIFGISSDGALKVKDIDGLLIYRAKCCNPIRGEDILGYITRGKGIAVHARRCENVNNLLYEADRKINVSWTGTTEELYAVKLSISVDDKQGMLAEITFRISGIKTNIKNIEAQTFEDHHRLIHITIEVRNLRHLEKTIDSIKQIEGVNEINWT